MTEYMKPCAVVCCVLYIVLFLFLPVLSVALVGIGFSGADLMGQSGWVWLVLVCGVGMGVCALVLPGKIAALVSLVGALIPLISFLLIRGQVLDVGNTVSGVLGLGGAGRIVSGAISSVLKIGVGTILSMICGIGSAVLCFLSEGQGRATTRTPGLGNDTGDEW